MSSYLSIIAGFIVFGVWMTIVGNPHVVETVIGLVLALATGIWVRRKFGKK